MQRSLNPLQFTRSVSESPKADSNQQYVAWLRRISSDQPEAILGVLAYWMRDVAEPQHQAAA